MLAFDPVKLILGSIRAGFCHGDCALAAEGGEAGDAREASACDGGIRGQTGIVMALLPMDSGELASLGAREAEPAR